VLPPPVVSSRGLSLPIISPVAWGDGQADPKSRRSDGWWRTSAWAKVERDILLFRVPRPVSLTSGAPPPFLRLFDQPLGQPLHIVELRRVARKIDSTCRAKSGIKPPGAWARLAHYQARKLQPLGVGPSGERLWSTPRPPARVKPHLLGIPVCLRLYLGKSRMSLMMVSRLSPEAHRLGVFALCFRKVHAIRSPSYR